MNDTAFAEAMTHHQAGRIGAAAELYRAILDREPNHADSLQLLGLITGRRSPRRDPMRTSPSLSCRRCRNPITSMRSGRPT